MTCETCKHYTTKLVLDRSGIGRRAELCARSGTSTAFERTSEGEQYCGAEAKHWEAKI